MKKKLFLLIVLIVLFVFGVLIYDFSDEVDEVLLKNKWYFDSNNEIYILSFKDNKLEFVTEDGKKYEDYNNCTYQFNKNVSMLKLKCDKGSKKLFIKEYDDKKLVLNEDNIDKYFYSSRELALIENFKKTNNLTDNDYNSLISINFEDDLFINYKVFHDLLKSKIKVYVGIISNNISYENVYNYQVLNNLINNSSKKFYLLNVNDLTEEEITKLKKYIKQDSYDNKLYVYEVNNKKIKVKVIIDTINKNDINNYKNI